MLVGGVLVGQDMIRAGQLRSLAKQIDQVQVAVNLFTDKYSGLPGDITNATSFWGAADGGDGIGADCIDAISVGTTTCNGNGNDLLDLTQGLPEESAHEWFHAWVHLKNAGLIEGNYTGKRTAEPRGATPGVNVLQATINNVGLTLMSYTPAPSEPYWYTANYKLILAVGTSSQTVETYNAGFSPSEIWSIDKKNDDGMPGNGKIRTLVKAECVSSTNNADYLTATYNFNNEQKSCAFISSFEDPGH